MRVGTSCQCHFCMCSTQDHPHACGDKTRRTHRYQSRTGSSPCVWGQVRSLHRDNAVLRIIPMRVGTRISSTLTSWSMWDHPHACGDKASNPLVLSMTSGSSPCVWGQVETVLNDSWDKRIIPMRVGTRLKKSRKIAVLQNQPLRFPLTFHRSFV